ncbi:MAG: transposase, partial [Pseudomonas sp.]
MLDAIRTLARAGCGWRMLQVHFGPWQTVYWWFRRFARRLLFQTIHDIALMPDREREGREASPSGGVFDSQTVKAPHAPDGVGLRCRQADQGAQAPRCGGYGRAPADGQPDLSRYPGCSRGRADHRGGAQ